MAWLLRARKTLQRRCKNKLLDAGSDASHQDDAAERQRGRLLPLTGGLKAAEDPVIRYRQSFSEEMKSLEQVNSKVNRLSCLQDEKPLKRSSRLYGLNPFVENDLLRVGRRLQRSEVPYEVKHPAILPKRGHVTELLIRDAHETLGHQDIKACTGLAPIPILDHFGELIGPITTEEMRVM